MTSHSEWNDEYTILRDLSLAQGYTVPAPLSTTLSENERPPNTKEVEEDFFGHCLDGDTLEGPDFILIQEMLDRVRGTSISIEYEEESDQCRNKTPELNGDVKRTSKKKRQNVAINSLLHMQKLKSNNVSSDTTSKLLKWDPSSMFKRKSTVQSCKSDTSISPAPTPKAYEPAVYRPSRNAEEYRQRFDAQRKILDEQQKVKENVADDLWSYVDTAIRERKAAEQIKLASVQANTSIPELNNNNTEGLSGPPAIILPQHRHLLTGACAVCEVVRSRGHDVDAWGTNDA